MPTFFMPVIAAVLLAFSADAVPSPVSPPVARYKRSPIPILERRSPILIVTWRISKIRKYPDG